jgi:hypothetical protein
VRKTASRLGLFRAARPYYEEATRESGAVEKQHSTTMTRPRVSTVQLAQGRDEEHETQGCAGTGSRFGFAWEGGRPEELGHQRLRRSAALHRMGHAWVFINTESADDHLRLHSKLTKSTSADWHSRPTAPAQLPRAVAHSLAAAVWGAHLLGVQG